jgi:phosphatidylglycerol:prolipoprotein diacylglycerol transferase
MRFVAEYFREPDAHLGLLALGLSMGQWLCVPMLLVGVAMMVWAKRRVVA